MSKLVITTDRDQLLDEGGSAAIACSLGESTRLGDRIGEPVLVATDDGSLFRNFVALGTLRGFTRLSDGKVVADIVDIRIFPKEVQDSSAPSAGFSEISDFDFQQTIEQGTDGFAEALAPISQARFSRELAPFYNHHCGFSDVRTIEGAAFIIQPLDQGGRWHLNNFLFLDPEPGRLFEKFAWSVGPRFEIVIDAHATTSDIADTVNRTGLLALPDRLTIWPDRAALAWHFEKFSQRLKRSG